MSDIVERLRAIIHPACREKAIEAADEIERLRSLPRVDKHDHDLLREELEFAEGKYLACYNAKCEVDREIERLRADNKLLQEDLARCRAFYEAWMTARRALKLAHLGAVDRDPHRPR